MKAYPTNFKWKEFAPPLTSYKPGTKFRTANGMIVMSRDGGLKSLKVLSYVPGLEWPERKHGGTWNRDGSKMFPNDWPPNSHIVEALQ